MGDLDGIQNFPGDKHLGETEGIFSGDLSLVDGGTPTLSLGTIPWPRVPG